MKRATEHQTTTRSTVHSNGARGNSGQFRHKKQVAHLHSGCNIPTPTFPGKALSQCQRQSCNSGSHLRGKVLQKDLAYQLPRAPLASHGKSTQKWWLNPEGLVRSERPENIVLQRAEMCLIPHWVHWAQFSGASDSLLYHEGAESKASS